MNPLRTTLRTAIIALSLSVAGAAAKADDRAPETAIAAPQRQQVLVLLRMPPAHATPGGFGGAYGDNDGQAARRREAARIAAANGLELVDGWPMPLLGVDCYVMNLPAGVAAETVVAALSKTPGVVEAQISHVYRAQGASTRPDPLYRAQPAARAWRLDDLHRVATGQGVRIAVIDSQVDTAHPDLAGQVSVSRNFVMAAPAAPESHGTGVAGVIAARADNGMGIMGVAPGSRVMALRACWQTPGDGGTICDTYSLAQALHYAIDNHAEVINLSLAGPPDPVLSRLIDIAVSRGIRVVAAYDPTLPKGGFPASHAGVIAVSDDPPTPTGVYNAPGHAIPTTQPGGRWYVVDGSSYAAAHVSGLLALGRERQAKARRQMQLVASHGDGAIDACASLLQVSAGANSTCAPSSDRSQATR